MFGVCEMCLVEKELTFHHLIPRTLHDNKWFRKNFDLQYMQKTGINVCKCCHRGIHDIYSEKELGKNFNTKEKLLSDEKIIKHAKWSSKQKS
jgi:hypothetical protein